MLWIFPLDIASGYVVADYRICLLKLDLLCLPVAQGDRKPSLETT